MLIEGARKLMHLRQDHAAWLLLTSRRAPLVLGCFKALFAEQGEILLEDLYLRLGELFRQYVDVEEFELRAENTVQMSRKEVREWLKKGLVVEREGRVFSTDALQRALNFVEGLEERGMTSTASRLAVVQREIESLEAALNPQKESRVAFLKKKIAESEAELARVEAGDFEALGGRKAVERIREVYQLASSLKADFRLVEDSFREADRQLRQQITAMDQDRGSVLDGLLDTHDALLATPEGQVFDGFYEQLGREVVLDEMKANLREILRRPSAIEALSRRQRDDLQYLVAGLVEESQRVIEARSQGERDVKSYVKTGLASENFRVGVLLNELLDAAVGVNWESQRMRRRGSDFRPLGVAVGNLPLVQRLRFHRADLEEGERMDLTETRVEMDDLGADFWSAFESLDQARLFADTLSALRERGEPLRLSALAEICESDHDLETVAYWLGLAREAGADFSAEREKLRVRHEAGAVEFDIPLVHLEAGALEGIDPETLG